ncbi:MAG TPA: hypothetical protein VGK27_06925 [Candidatus Deferrimicrobiaceae bacterium]
MAPISSTFRKAYLGIVALFLGLSATARADSHLLYFEAQGVAGYSTLEDKPVFNSMNPDAEMQRSSVGFDYLHRFSGEGGDFGSLGIQGRLAYNRNAEGENDPRVEPQLYNAWFKLKTPWTDAWIGHNRPAFGLGSYFDSHPLLLRTLPIQGFGYDRDWGVGTYRDFSRGNLQLSATTGTGMPLEAKGNYMLAGRISYGVLAEDNFSAGLSLALGRTLDTMGYKVRNADPAMMRLAGADLALLRNRFEHRFDLLAGKWLGADTVAAMYRLGILLDAEGRMKLEAQPTWWRVDGEGGENLLLSACFTGLVTSDLASRTMYEYDRDRGDHRIVTQIYLYKPM